MVSDGRNVTVYDRRLKTFDRYPLGATPLALFLARHIRLDKGVMVTRVARIADGFSITARDGRQAGRRAAITLTFADSADGAARLDGDRRPGRADPRAADRPDARRRPLDPALFVLKDPRRKPARTAGV